MIEDDGRSGDNIVRKTVPDESPVDKPIEGGPDDKDYGDDDLQPRSTSPPARPASVRDLLSKPPAWLQNQMRYCREQGCPTNQLKALAASVAADLYADATKGAEILSEVEAFMTHGLECDCEACL